LEGSPEGDLDVWSMLGRNLGVERILGGGLVIIPEKGLVMVG